MPRADAPRLAVAEIAYPAHLYQPRHAHRHASVTLVLAGSLEERVGRHTERGLALGVVVKPAGVEHDDRFGGGGADTVQIELSAEASAELEHRGELLDRWRWVPAGTAVAPFVRLVEALRVGAVPGEVQDCGWDVLGALAAEVAAQPAAGGTPPAWLARVRETADDLGGACRVGELAAAAGVHPVHATREFRRYYGTTLSDHLQRRRLQRAAELIARSDAPIAVAAARAGFADQSHLGRQLRARTGVTPSRLRAAARRRTLQTF